MILNLYVKSIETKVYMPQEELSKHHNINITNEININNPSLIGEPAMLKVNWSLSINYLNPSIGYIRLTGAINYSHSEPESLLKILPNDIKNEMANAILANFASYLIETAKLHNIPSPIPLPRITFEEVKKNNTNTGYHG